MLLDLGENVVILPVLVALFHKTIAWEEHQDSTRSHFCDLGQGVSKIHIDLRVFTILITEIETTSTYSLGEYRNENLPRVDDMWIFEPLREVKTKLSLERIHGG